MISPGLLLRIIAVVFLIMAAFNVPSTRVTWGWLGLALWLLSTMVHA